MGYKSRQQQNAYQNEWLKRKRKRLRAEWFAANGPCKACDSWDGLEVDHIDPAQKVSHNVWSWSVQRREAELAKCQPLCENCHSLKHYGIIPEHGVNAWRKGCRCRVCVQAKLADTYAWRLRRFGSKSSHGRVSELAPIVQQERAQVS